jgi:hypothetical protein
MYNLTITIWPTFDGNDPETRSAGGTAQKDLESQKSGSGTSPPDH